MVMSLEDSAIEGLLSLMMGKSHIVWRLVWSKYKEKSLSSGVTQILHNAL